MCVFDYAFLITRVRICEGYLRVRICEGCLRVRICEGYLRVRICKGYFYWWLDSRLYECVRVCVYEYSLCVCMWRRVRDILIVGLILCVCVCVCVCVYEFFYVHVCAYVRGIF